MAQIVAAQWIFVVIAVCLCTFVFGALDGTSDCEEYEYYDVSNGVCKHCDTACFERVNITYIRFVESRCFDFCPGYMSRPRVAAAATVTDTTLSMVEGSVVGFIAAVFFVSIIVTVIWRRDLAKMLKRCCQRAKNIKQLGLFVDDRDWGETSYVKLSDPVDEVEIVYRVTCV